MAMMDSVGSRESAGIFNLAQELTFVAQKFQKLAQEFQKLAQEYRLFAQESNDGHDGLSRLCRLIKAM